MKLLLTRGGCGVLDMGVVCSVLDMGVVFWIWVWYVRYESGMLDMGVSLHMT